VVNNRLEKVIDKVTSIAQKAYNSKRFIHEALINIIDTIRNCELNNIAGAILSIDQKKAFDSVYYGFAWEVYKFFWFGVKFIKLMETIGTGRTARVILDGKSSRCIQLRCGFAQGNSPSPRKYNIIEQVLIFRLEYDPKIRSVYLVNLIPSTVNANGEVEYPLLEIAERKGLKVDTKLLYTNRKTNAFADDTNCGVLREAGNMV